MADYRLLLIVDPQIDFITGSLPVPGAPKAMDALAEYVANHALEYKVICVTCDRHPLRHTSFSSNGGMWPAHCVESSVGAAVWPILMHALENHPDLVHFLYKGEDPTKDEYSIFQSVKGVSRMENYFKYYEISSVDICGLAGDVCVAKTLQDGVRLHPSISFHILDKFTASLDGGSLLSSILKTIPQ